jgi:hypothetical protein
MTRVSQSTPRSAPDFLGSIQSGDCGFAQKSGAEPHVEIKSPKTISQLDRARWNRSLGRRVGKLVRDRANLAVAKHGVQLPDDAAIIDVLEQNAVVTLVYVAELRRRFRIFEKNNPTSVQFLLK